MIPRPYVKTKTFEEECNIMENFQEVDDEGQRPHESLGNVSSRDTPIKRNALLNKQKLTHRTSRNASPAYNTGSHTTGSKMFGSKAVKKPMGHSATFVDEANRVTDLL